MHLFITFLHYNTIIINFIPFLIIHISYLYFSIIIDNLITSFPNL